VACNFVTEVAMLTVSISAKFVDVLVIIWFQCWSKILGNLTYADDREVDKVVMWWLITRKMHWCQYVNGNLVALCDKRLNCSKLQPTRCNVFLIYLFLQTLYQYKKIKTILYKNIAAIWYSKTCRIKSSFLTGAQDSHLQRVTIPEAAHIQLQRGPPDHEQG